jgi:hypothetical protein
VPAAFVARASGRDATNAVVHVTAMLRSAAAGAS